MKNSLKYRKDRIKNMSKKWDLKLVNPFFLEWKIPESILYDLNFCIKKYISKALHIQFFDNDEIFVEMVEKNIGNRTNVTPNGAVVPKKEYVMEYNLFLNSWCNVVRNMTKNFPELLSRFRVTPNIRIKYGNELEDNIGRELDTAIPHSDAWLEGPWGMNCHVPILGDTNNNFLKFYKLKEEHLFNDEFLTTSKSYKDMQWVLSNYEEDSIVPKKNHVNISDYSLLHNTKRSKNSKTRISIDTTINVGEHPVHPDREIEYLNFIPKIGEDLFVRCEISEKHDFQNKKSTFSNYTTGSLTRINLKN